MVVVIAPICAMAALVLFFLFPLWIMDKRDFEDSPEARHRRQRWRLNAYKLVLFTLFLIYPGVSRTVLAMLVCVDVNGKVS